MDELPRRHVSARPAAGLSWINFLLGIWLIIAPFVLGYTRPAAYWNDIIVGVLVAAFSLFRTFGGYRDVGWSWLTGLLGIWLIIAPFVLGYSNYPTAQWNDIILGIIIAVLAWSSTGVRRRSEV